MTVGRWKLLALSAIIFFLQPVSAKAENFILISVDTLRADRLGCYGYRENATPNFDRWALEGYRFEHAYSETPLTLPAHSTLLLGILPVTHGIRENAGFRLDDARVTLAEVFQKAGYTTAGFIGSYVLASEFGLAQGFDVFDEQFDTPIESVLASTQLQRSSDVVTDSFLAWLARHHSQDFFAFIHFYDVHMPRPDGYDWEVSRVDRNLGRIDRYLRENGILAGTNIVLTSDHGEALGEHGESGHGFFIYDSTLRVPLIIRPARGRTGPDGGVPEPASLEDVMPTILELAGLPIPGEVQGRSLVPAFSGKHLPEKGVYAESFVPNLQFGWSPLRSIRLGNMKFIEAPRAELYDTAADPHEKRNLVDEVPEVARKLRKQLDRLVSGLPKPKTDEMHKEVDTELLKKLSTLGYVATGPTGSARSNRIDPKDRIEAFEEYHGMLNSLSSGEIPSDALERIERLRTGAPEIKGLDFLEAWTLELSGRLEESLEAYGKAVAEDPENLLARGRYATLLMRQRNFADAERQLLDILRIAPGDYKSRNNLAGLYHVTGRDDQAMAELETIVRARPTYVSAWQNLGNLLLSKQQWSRSEAAFRQVISLDPKNAICHFQLSRALAGQGKEAEAHREKQIAVELDPRLASR